MLFFNIFLKTLGFLIGLTTFIFLINLLIFFFTKNDNRFDLLDGQNESNNVIAILELNGPIISNIKNSISGNLIDYIDPEIVDEYLSHLINIKPKYLIIKINSPGGTVTASASLEKYIKNFKEISETKVYFYTNEILASGAYWVSTSGDKIYASYGSILGSIGVSGPSWYYYDKPLSISRGLFGQKIETQNGIQIYNQNAGNSKDLYNPFRKPSNKELDHLEKIIQDIYNDFLIKVSKSRNLEIEFIKNEIGALIFNSKQAKNNFLIDEVIDLKKLINQIIKVNNFKDYKVIKLKFRDNFLNKYFTSHISKNSIILCNKLNSNFISLLPIFLNEC